MEGEKEADTPAGNPEAAKDTETGFPEPRVAVMPSDTELRCATESAGDTAESEMADPWTGGAAVIVRATVVLDEGAVPVPVTAIL